MDLFDQSNCVDQTDQMDGVDMQKCQYYLFRCHSTQFYAIVFLLSTNIILAVISLLLDYCVFVSLPRISRQKRASWSAPASM